MRIYVAGPYSNGDIGANVQRALDIGHILMDIGHTPFIPHLYHFMHIHSQRTYESWLEQGMGWLEASDLLFKLHGYSPGAEREEKRARELGIEVVKDIRAVPNYLEYRRTHASPATGPSKSTKKPVRVVDLGPLGY